MQLIRGWLISLAICPAGIGCGTVDPRSRDTESMDYVDKDGGDTEIVAKDDYYPMAEGDFWTYRETEDDSVVKFTYTVTGAETIDFGRDTGERTVFVVENTFASAVSSSAAGEGRTQYIENRGDRAVRHRQDIYDETGFTKQRDFFPGFLRFDRTKTSQGQEWTETILRVSDPKDNTLPVEEEVSYDYEVLNIAASVEIGSKIYSCIQIKRTCRLDEEEKFYWFAKGIGKVQELTGDKLEQLIDSSYF